MLALPMFPEMTAEQQARVVQTIAAFGGQQSPGGVISLEPSARTAGVSPWVASPTG